MGRAAALTAHPLAPPHPPEVDGAGAFLARMGMATARPRARAGGRRDADRTRQRVQAPHKKTALALLAAFLRP